MNGRKTVYLHVILGLFIAVLSGGLGFILRDCMADSDSGRSAAGFEEKALAVDISELLQEGEQQFLEEHLYGQWRFANRVVGIDENNGHHRAANISDAGVEELKQTAVMLYGEDVVRFPVEIEQNSFSNARDMYFWAAYGGFSWTRKPIYEMNRLDTDTIVLRDVYNWWEGYEVQMQGWEDYIHVHYYASHAQESIHYYGSDIYLPFGSDIYVNPSDTDTIYVDFCGLWEMTRDDTNYNTNEKTEPLSEEEQQFLEEHLYGQWRFAERVVEIDDTNHDRQGVTANISDAGVEELKQIAVLLYEEAAIQFSVEIGQDSFSNAQDMYLFAANGGVSWTRKPIYEMNRLDTDTIVLRDVYNWREGYEVQMQGWEDYVHVHYYVPDEQESMQHGNIYSAFGSDIYVNPNDTDTIYIDFCGLWEMTRDDTNYSTNGKYFGPG